MNETTIRKNVTVLYRTKDLDKAIWKVDDRGKISKISRYNLMGRFVNWCSNGEDNKAKIQLAVQDTILGIEDLCDPATHTKYQLKKNYVLPNPDSPLRDHYVAVLNKIKRSVKFQDLVQDADKRVNDMRENAGLDTYDL